MATSIINPGAIIPQNSASVPTLSGEPISNNGLTYNLIDTVAALSDLVDTLDDLPTYPPSLYIDLEGENLSRLGTISILQLYVLPRKHTHLIDVCALGEKSFSSHGKKGLTLRDILESPTIPKVFFDVRNDSDALFSHFQINLAGIQDLQLMEFATRSAFKKFLCGLAKCIEKDAQLSHTERLAWSSVKEKGYQLFNPGSGGSFKVFRERPLSQEIVRYCVQDVQYLPHLWGYYNGKLAPAWRQRVLDESQARVRLSQSASYNGTGMHMALPPPEWST